MKTVVSDTSPLVAFSFLELQQLLPSLLGESNRAGGGARDRRSSLWVRRYRRKFATRCCCAYPDESSAHQRPGREIDEGEAESIALAVEVRAELVIVDDAASRQAATNMGLTVTGTIGLLLRAKQAGKFAAVRPLLDRLRRELRFFVSQTLYEHALTAAGE